MGGEKVVAKNGPFSLTFCQIVALMLPHRSVFAGLLLVAIFLPPLLKWRWLSHRKKRANAMPNSQCTKRETGSASSRRATVIGVLRLMRA